MQGPDDYTFDVCVSDGTLSDCEPITVTVNDPNEAPVLTAIGSKNVDELVQLSFTATATDADLPAQPLTLQSERAAQRGQHHHGRRVHLDADGSAGARSLFF